MSPEKKQELLDNIREAADIAWGDVQAGTAGHQSDVLQEIFKDLQKLEAFADYHLKSTRNGRKQ